MMQSSKNSSSSSFLQVMLLTVLEMMALLVLFQSTEIHGFTVSSSSSFSSSFSSSQEVSSSARAAARNNKYTSLQSSGNDNNNNSSNTPIATMDVSDLNLTMEDLNKPLPKELLMGIERSGYQSTSRIPTIEDNGCYWTENAYDSDGSTIDVTLTIPGLRGQPAECLSVLFSTTTISVTAFGRVVWSCIQRGSSVPEGCSFLTEDGKDMIPVIQLSVEKKDKGEVWDGFILQVGEDSIL